MKTDDAQQTLRFFVKSLYVSYSHSEVDKVLPLRKALEARGIKTLTNDKKSPANPKSGWHSFLEYQMPYSYGLLIILTPHSANWEWFTQEIEQANLRRLPIFVVHLANPLIHLPALATLDIRRVHIQQRDEFEQGVTQLLEWLLPLQEAHHTRHLKPLLQKVVLELPESRWGVLQDMNGLLHAAYHRENALHEDRVTAMSMSYLGISERMTHDFELGFFHYTFLAGEQGISLVVLMGDAWLLTLCFARIASYDAVFAKLSELLKPICEFFNISGMPFLPKGK